MTSPFELPFFQDGVIVVLLLAIASGLLGTWVVLRGLAFFAHAAGTATFPGLVLADGLGFAAVLGAFGSALAVTGLIAVAGSRREDSRNSVTAIVLAASLAVGAILASDVFGSQARVDRLLFGSLLAIDAGDQALAALAATGAVAGSLLLGPRWLATGFEGGLASRGRRTDPVLVALVALAAVAALSAVGALLATTLIVVPAATARLVTSRMWSWQSVSVALAAVEGVGGLWLSYELNAPPGAGIAVLAGAVFAATAIVREAGRRRVPAVAALTIGAAVLTVSACGSSSGDRPGGARLRVVATTTQLGDLAREVGGAGADVREILEPGSDAHSYEPRPRDVGAIAGADVVLLSGLGLDDWAGELIDASGSEAEVVDVGASLPRLRRAAGGATDPHWWHDPRNAIAATAALERALVRAGSPRAAVGAGARAYRSRLRRIDRRIERCIARVPARERKIVSDHDSIGYFTDRYGIRLVGAVFPAQSVQAQASAGAVAALERVIEAEGVKAVFPDAALNSRLAERVAQDTGASADHSLYGDTLGARGSSADTYAGMLTTNADSLVRGMSGGRVRCEVAR